jgi:hypothetical protein
MRVYAPADITSIACGVYWKSFKKLVIVSPAAKRGSLRIPVRNSRLVGGPHIDDLLSSSVMPAMVFSLDSE